MKDWLFTGSLTFITTSMITSLLGEILASGSSLIQPMLIINMMRSRLILSQAAENGEIIRRVKFEFVSNSDI